MGRFLTPTAFAEEIGMSYRSVMNMKRNGELPIRWISPKRYRIDIDAYYASRPAEHYPEGYETASANV